MPGEATMIKQQVIAADASLAAARIAAVKACACRNRDCQDDPAIEAIDQASDRLRQLEYSLRKMQRRAEFYRRWLCSMIPSKMIKEKLRRFEEHSF